jgi:cyclic-di-AMP phosphodiesterase PgpH
VSDASRPVSLTKPKPRHSRLGRVLSSGIGRENIPVRDVARLLMFGLALLSLSIASVAIDWGSGDVAVRAGDAASETIKAPETTTFESDLRTEERRQEAYADERNIVRTYDERVRAEQTEQIRSFNGQVDTIRDQRSRPIDERSNDLRSILEELAPNEAEQILELSDASWGRVSSEAERLVDTTLANSLQPEDIARVKEDLGDRVSGSLSSEERTLAVTIARPYIRANVSIDEAQTQANREQAAAEVEPFPVAVLSGQAIIRDGDIITKYDVEKLEKLGLLSPGLDTATRLGRSGLVSILTIALIAYLFRFHRDVWRGRQLLLVTIAVLGPILMGRLILPHEDIQYMFPVAAAAMLLSVLLDFQIAVVIAGLLSMYLGVIDGMSIEIVLLYFLSSAAGAFMIWRAERTMTFVWAGVAVFATSFSVALCFKGLESDITSAVVGELLVETIVMGALAASLTFLSFSLLGSLFGITTHLQLLELAHPNQPLLYRLAREAPGTYHHSIVVSNLAESAVEIVGGDPLFARVAVLYHDIGKIVRPTFFIENQANMENPHDLLDPRVSARVIVDHVSDGVRLAHKARLPQSMIDVIEQHHGTTLIRYFYSKTVEAGGDVDESEFRYSGPKPQSKEAGVIMLADSTEAAVRASAMGGRLVNSRQANAARSETLEGIVDRVIQERLEDGQLSECDLTLREIELIRRTFVSILEGIYHPRIDYPELKKPAPPVPVAAGRIDAAGA